MCCVVCGISPDGRTLFCLTLRREDLTLTLDLTVLDTATGNTLFQKKGFMDLSVETFIILDIFHRLSSFEYLLPGSVSADGNVFLPGAGANKMAFDLRTQAPVPVGKDIKSSINGPYAFLGNDKVVGDMFNGRSIAGPIIWDTAIFSFPDGKKLQNFPFRVNNFESVTSENYFLTHHYGEYPGRSPMSPPPSSSLHPKLPPWTCGMGCCSTKIPMAAWCCTRSATNPTPTR